MCVRVHGWVDVCLVIGMSGWVCVQLWACVGGCVCDTAGEWMVVCMVGVFNSLQLVAWLVGFFGLVVVGGFYLVVWFVG